MKFNLAKFENVRYGKNKDLANICNFLTPNAEDVIERKEIFRYLDIMINEKAHFTDHINHICAKVN